jgi:hypothetical protein
VWFGAVETGVEPPTSSRRRTRPGGDPEGVSPEDTEALFDLHIRYLIEGIARDAVADGIARDAVADSAPAPTPRKEVRR